MRHKLPREITQKVYKHDLWFLHSPRRLLLIDSHAKFHRDILNGFQVKERTRFHDKVPREIIKKMNHCNSYGLCVHVPRAGIDLQTYCLS